MPTASLLVMTSPLLLGPVPAAGLIETSAASPLIVAAETMNRRDVSILPLAWTLAEAASHQAQDQGPQDTSATASSAAQTDAQPGGEPSEESENEIVVEGDYGPPESDPMGAINETTYRLTQDLDEVLLEPVAYAYRDGLPDPLRDGLGNVVRNLGEPANFLNFLLQFKIGKAFETLGRFAINSTLGVGGLFDIAGEPGIGLPYRRNGFANTLGYYGVDTGAYLYLPITGATTVRDLIGSTLDQAVLPFAVGAPFDRFEYGAAYFVINGLDSRLEFDEEMELLGNTVDPYAARRDTYLARREREIALLRGEEPPEPPAILEELENELECGDVVCDEGLQTDSDAETPGAPNLSLGFQRELPPIADAVTITQPTTR